MEHPHSGADASNGDRDEVLRKIGRNVLLFQQAERRLKWLAARGRISGLSGEIEAAAAKLREQVAGETLGTVMRRTVDAPGLSEREQERIEAEVVEKGGAHWEISFNMTDANGEPDAAWRERLEALVKDRNDLVHHFLGRFDLESPEGCLLAGHHLDQQHDEHAPLVEELRRRCDSLTEAAGLLSAALRQEDIIAEFLHGHLWLGLEDVLRRAAAEKGRADGWTYLSLVGKELADKEPGLLKSLEDAFGPRGLKQAVATMSRWELREEPTAGGTRVLYRPA